MTTPIITTAIILAFMLLFLAMSLVMFLFPKWVTKSKTLYLDFETGGLGYKKTMGLICAYYDDYNYLYQRLIRSELAIFYEFKPIVLERHVYGLEPDSFDIVYDYWTISQAKDERHWRILNYCLGRNFKMGDIIKLATEYKLDL